MTKQLLTLDDRLPSEGKHDAGDGFHSARFLPDNSAILSGAVAHTAAERSDFNQEAGARLPLFHSASFYHSDQLPDRTPYGECASGSGFTEKEKLEKSTWIVPRTFHKPRIGHSLYDVPKTEIMIEPPPKLEQRFIANWRSVLFAPMMILLFIVVLISMTLIARVTASGLYFILIAVMALIALSGGVLDYRLQARQWSKNNRVNKQQYLNYLKKLESEWDIRAAQQLRNQVIQDPSIEGCIALMESKSKRIWERADQAEDFLCVRLGRGRRPFEIGILTPPTLYEDRKQELNIQMRYLAESHRYISPAPVLCDLKQHSLIGIIGKTSETTRVMQSVLMQIATFHSPEQVEIILLGAEQNARDWGTLSCLPHVRREVETPEKDHETGEGRAQRILEECKQRMRLKTGASEKRHNRFLVLMALQDAARKRRDIEALSLLANCSSKTCVILQSEMESDLPPQINIIMHVAGSNGELYDRSEAEPDQQISLDLASAEQVSRFVGAVLR